MSHYEMTTVELSSRPICRTVPFCVRGEQWGPISGQSSSVKSTVSTYSPLAAHSAAAPTSPSAETLTLTHPPGLFRASLVPPFCSFDHESSCTDVAAHGEVRSHSVCPPVATDSTWSHALRVYPCCREGRGGLLFFRLNALHFAYKHTSVSPFLCLSICPRLHRLPPHVGGWERGRGAAEVPSFQMVTCFLWTHAQQWSCWVARCSSGSGLLRIHRTVFLAAAPITHPPRHFLLTFCYQPSGQVCGDLPVPGDE